ncbi:MAG TPA: calcium-binding protein, partial [Thermomicrobiales bacterium]|nr:calcium-binding protein [Thermomicrobiales bacterium]
LDGGLGDDTFRVTVGDSLVDAGGSDTVLSETDWTLAPGFENLTLLAGAATSAQGNNSDNRIEGNELDDSINGRAGNDTLIGNAGNDTFDMSTGGTASYGNDSIDGGSGIDAIDWGSNAQSALAVDLAAGTASGGGAGGAGSAILAAIENVAGGAGDDRITGNDADNFFFGFSGNDTLVGAAGADRLEGSDGNDWLEGGAGADALNGGAGLDSFSFTAAPGASNADQVTDFASGSDTLRLDARAMDGLGANGDFAADDARFHAASGASGGHDATDRVVYDTSSGNLWYDADGSGAGAAQLIATLSGAPALAATDIAVDNGTAPGGQTIDGTDGNDVLRGGPGNDTMLGHGGNDTFDMSVDGSSSYGADSLDGGTGTDAVYFNGSFPQSGIRIDLAAGTLSGGGASGAGSATLASIESVLGTVFADQITGSSAGNYLYAWNGDDTVAGGGGNDTVYGANGNDVLNAGAGNDYLVGGADADRFVFDQTAGAANADRLLDFVSGEDRIELDASVMGALGAAGDFGEADARFFAAAGAAGGHDADDRIVYNSSSGQLYYDDDGSGAHAAQLIATLQAGATPVATDFSVFGSPPASTGTEGDDHLEGTVNADSIDGLSGNDFIEGGSGNDTLNGDAGNDLILGNADDDSIVGGDGDDVLEGDEGDDVEIGGAGNDFLGGDHRDFDSGSDTLDGGLGNDTYIAHSDDTLVDSGGIDTVRVQGESWTLAASFENLIFFNVKEDNGFHGLVGTGNDLDNVINGLQG